MNTAIRSLGFIIGATASAIVAGCSSDSGGAPVPTFTSPFDDTESTTQPNQPGASEEDQVTPNVSGGESSNEAQGGTGDDTARGSEGPGDVPLVDGERADDSNGGASNDPAVDDAAGTEGSQPPPAEPPGTEPAEPAPPPEGYFSTGSWQGFVSTTPVFDGTTLDFTFPQEGEPFCLAGSVAGDPEFRGAARLQFNLNQAQEAGAEPGTVVPQGNGLAFTFTRSTGAMLRVQLETPDGTDFCYSIPEVRGRAFVPYAELNTECYTDDSATAQSYARQPVQTLTFEVPGGRDAALPYDFCVAGFADAQGIGDAPPEPAGFSDTTIQGNLSETDQRAVVEGDNGQKYVVFNNAWGNTSFDGSQVISYSDNSFRIDQQSAPPNGNVPVSFPSIFLGASGYNGGDNALATRVTDRMPAQVSSIASIPTRFAHNATNGDFNATYDVWFANEPLENGYETATAAFLMVWTYKPNRNAIGQVVANNVDIAGHSWQLVAGRRGEGGDANAADANSAVISYITNDGAITDLSFDLMDFIDDAVQRSQNNQLNGQQFNRNLYLTDIFAGFEIWGGGTGLEVQAFEAEVLRQ